MRLCILRLYIAHKSGVKSTIAPTRHGRPSAIASNSKGRPRTPGTAKRVSDLADESGGHRIGYAEAMRQPVFWKVIRPEEQVVQANGGPEVLGQGVGGCLVMPTVEHRTNDDIPKGAQLP